MCQGFPREMHGCRKRNTEFAFHIVRRDVACRVSTTTVNWDCLNRNHLSIPTFLKPVLEQTTGKYIISTLAGLSE